MAKPRDDSTDSNRRNFFRINRDIIFDFRPVSAYEANQADAGSFFEAHESTQVAAELRTLERQVSQSLKVLAEKDPHLGEYLRILTQKIDLLARHALLPQQTVDSLPRKRVNLSEAGLAFNSDKAYYTGKFLALRMIFLPDYATISAFGEVTRCLNKSGTNDAQNELFEIAVRFHRLQEKDRQELSRQILKAQVAHRKPLAAKGTASGSHAGKKFE